MVSEMRVRIAATTRSVAAPKCLSRSLMGPELNTVNRWRYAPVLQQNRAPSALYTTAYRAATVAKVKAENSGFPRWWWYSLGIGGASLGAGYAYFHYTIYLPNQELYNRLLLGSSPPVRKTPIYTAGTNKTPPEIDHTMNEFWYTLYMVYRILLLCTRLAPITWMFLLMQVGLCSPSIFYSQLLMCFQALGPSYIKLGQWMASRPDVFPQEMCDTLSTLFDNTTPHPWKHTEALLREANVLAALSEIEKEPINSGSIAQIHRAVLRDTYDDVPRGRQVAVKVLHPGIRAMIAADLTAMNLAVSFLTTVVPWMTYLDLRTSLLEFYHLIASQLDMEQECDNLQQFRYNFQGVRGIVIPAPIPSLSNRNVLMETYEVGTPVQDVESSDHNRDLAEIGCHMFLKMLFQDNFVHSDLHPGNLLLRDASNRSAAALGSRPATEAKESVPRYESRFKVLGKDERQLVLLDAGLVTTLSKKERENFIALFAAIACGDGKLGAQLMLERQPQEYRGRCKDPEKFGRDMQAIFQSLGPGTEGFTLKKIEIGKVLGQVMRCVREHKIGIDGGFASLVMAVIVGEGLGRKLSPNFNIFAEAAPYVVEYLENTELYFLVNKLQSTYGTRQLLLDAVVMQKTPRYVEAMTRKMAAFLRWLVTGDRNTHAHVGIVS